MIDSKITKVFRYLFFVVLVNHFGIYASEVDLEYEPMGAPHAPLGAVWVQDLEESLKNYHKRMLSEELEKTDEEKGVNINFALFGLNIRTKAGEMISVLDRTRKIFSSGGEMLTDPSLEEKGLVSIGKIRKKCKEEIDYLEKKSAKAIFEIGQLPDKHQKKYDVYLKKFDEKVSKIQDLKRDIIENKEKLSKCNSDELAYSPSIFCHDSNEQEQNKKQKRYKDHTNALYDPEQTITRIVDYHVQNRIIDETHITINGKSFEKEQIDCFVLNLHSRTDMCPFCCMFLAHHLQGWQKLIDTTFMAIVTSRQEYRCDYEFITEKSYYKGYSMRSFGCQPAGKGASFEEIKTIADQGLVVQYAFEPWEIYK